MRTLYLSLLTAFLFAGACTDNHTTLQAPLGADRIPADAETPHILLSDVNYGVEQNLFFVTGVCSNESSKWQKIWLKGEFFGPVNDPVKIKGHPSAIIEAFSSAVPPKGRTAFFAFWPLEDFTVIPVNCRISGAGAITPAAGPILLAEQVSGVKMAAPAAPGQPATEEKAWQVSAVINNILPMEARRPMVELLLYGTDNKLWFSTMLDPADPKMKAFITQEKEGSMQPGEKRNIGINVFYDRLPQALKEKKIGKVDLLAFDKR